MRDAAEQTEAPGTAPRGGTGATPSLAAADLARRYERARHGWADGARDTGDHLLNPGHAAEFEGLARRPAAVLVPVMDRAEATVLLTRRADTLRKHSGQIAFPGGAVDPDETIEAAALREANEEVALAPSHVRRVIGPLPRYATGSGFLITPVLAVVDPAFRPVPAEAEVAEAFEVPLAFLMDPSNHGVGSGEWRGRVRRFYDMRYPADGTERRIWGATAGILRVMHELMFADGETSR